MSMSDDIEIPKFQPAIPDELMGLWHQLPPVERVLLKKQSVHEQQTEWIMRQMAGGEVRFQKIEAEVAALIRLKEILTAKWSVIAFIACAITGPVALAWLGVVFHKWLSKGP